MFLSIGSKTGNIHVRLMLDVEENIGKESLQLQIQRSPVLWARPLGRKWCLECSKNYLCLLICRDLTPRAIVRNFRIFQGGGNFTVCVSIRLWCYAVQELLAHTHDPDRDLPCAWPPKRGECFAPHLAFACQRQVPQVYL